MKRPNAVRSLSAIVRANASSVSVTCWRAASGESAGAVLAQPASPASARAGRAARTLFVRVDLVKDAVVAEVFRLGLCPAAEILDRHQRRNRLELRAVLRGN